MRARVWLCDLTSGDAGPKQLDVVPQTSIFALHFDRTGRLRFPISGGTIGTWDLRRGALIHKTRRRSSNAPLAITADGRWAAILDVVIQRLTLCDVQEDRDRYALPPEPSAVWCFELSPDGTRLALGRSDGGLSIWDLEQVRARLAEFGIVVPSTAVVRDEPAGVPPLSAADFEHMIKVQRATSRGSRGEILWRPGVALARQGKLADAEAALREAIRHKPDEGGASAVTPNWYVSAHDNLAAVLFRQGKYEQAEAAYREVIRLKPDYANAHHERGRILARQGKLADAEAAYREAASLEPKAVHTHLMLGDVRARLGRWDEAAAAFGRALELDPAGQPYWLGAVPLLHLHRGDVAAYRRACREMLEHFGPTDRPEIAARAAMACLLIRDPATLERAVKLAERATTGTEKLPAYRHFMMVRGVAEYRAGRHASAVEWLRRCQPQAQGEAAMVPARAPPDATVLAVLAMAHHRLGQAEEARAAFARARALVAKHSPDPTQGRPFDSNWQEWLRCQIFLGEAEALLKADETGERPTDRPPK
jgi:tetratricopeptide (TPR) repeat protein